MFNNILKNPTIGGAGGIATQAFKQAQSFVSSSAARLANAGLNPGGSTIPKPNNPSASATFAGEDRRAKLGLSPKSGNIFYRDNENYLLEPLRATNGIVWPYTPTINVAYTAAYSPQNLPHTNYAHYSYTHSSVEQITVTGQFTANTPQEAAYVLAVMTFLKSCTKMFYGRDQLRGTPPPVLRFSAYGKNMFNSIPVVVSNYNQDLEGAVDYIEAPVMNVEGDDDWNEVSLIPTLMNITCTLMPIVTRNATTKFSLEEYSRGTLIGSKDGPGGFI